MAFGHSSEFKILPLGPGLVASLEKGIDVLEVGGGSGRAINVVAKAFPNSRFVGYDLIPQQIDMAAEEAASWGLQNARFEVNDVSTLAQRDHFDLVMAFDTVHDQAQPASLLNQVAAALRPGGLFLMWDIAASSHLHNNKDHLLVRFSMPCRACTA